MVVVADFREVVEHHVNHGIDIGVHLQADGQCRRCPWVDRGGNGRKGAVAASAIDPTGVECPVGWPDKAWLQVVGHLHVARGYGSLVKHFDAELNDVCGVDRTTLVGGKCFAQREVKGLGLVDVNKRDVVVVLVGVFIVDGVIGERSIIAIVAVWRAVVITIARWVLVNTNLGKVVQTSGCSGIQSRIHLEHQGHTSASSWSKSIAEAYRSGVAACCINPIRVERSTGGPHKASLQVIGDLHSHRCRLGSLVKDFNGEAHVVARVDGATLTCGKSFAQGQVKSVKRIDSYFRHIVVVLVGIFIVDCIVGQGSVVARIAVVGAVEVRIANWVVVVADFRVIEEFAHRIAIQGGIHLQSDENRRTLRWRNAAKQGHTRSVATCVVTPVRVERGARGPHKACL